MQDLIGGIILLLFGVPFVLIATAFLYWKLRYPTHTYRYNLTIEVNTPEGVRSGHAIREVIWRDGPLITMEAPAGMMKERGEAVAVDLPNGKTLFALLYSNNQGVTASLAFGTSRLTKDTNLRLVEIEKPERYNPVWGADGYPRLVYFANLADPKSVERLDPEDLQQDLGQGYLLKRITAQITNEAVTTEISERLARAGWKAGQALDQTRGVTAEPTLAQQLSYRDFSTGLNK